MSLKSHQEISEVWIQDLIVKEPAILGLGDLVLKDRERPNQGGGRLDLLLQDPETYDRYEVEIQLGATDPSHIIRCIEYWDRQRRLHPQYDHTAVIVAEDITTRFLNIINLFNGFIPIIALQMTAIEMAEGVGIIFTKIIEVQQLVWRKMMRRSISLPIGHTGRTKVPPPP